MPPEKRAAFVASQDGNLLREDLSSLISTHHSSEAYLEKLSESIVTPVLAAIAARPNAAGGMKAIQERLADSYHLEREIGGGGMSRVFLAEELKLKRRVVVKVLPETMVPTGNGLLLTREIELSAQLQHPHIVPLLAAESTGDLLYYTMPFVDGESLRELLLREGALPVEDAVRIWRQVLDAVAHAHANGVIHRDIKPGNILLSGRHAFVTDFGIARAIASAAGDAQLTMSGIAIGTPAYMAPEQASGAYETSPSVDIYQAGLVMYEMLAGRLPFPAGSAHEVLRARMSSDPLPLVCDAAPPGLVSLIMRCIARDPAQRPASAETVLAAIDDAYKVRVTAEPARLLRRHSVRAAIYIVAALGLVALLAYALRVAAPPPATSASTANVMPSLAVLPLTTVSTDPAGTAIADGMTQELIAVLGRNPDLRVIASTSVSGLDYRRMNAQQIARSLQVSHLLEGSIQREGSRLRMHVRLLDARQETTSWSETFDRQFTAIFDIQEEIATAVARSLAVRMAQAESRLSRPRRTSNAAAYEWYLRGMDIALIRNDKGRRQGIEYFTKAIASDPDFSSAHAGLAGMYINLSYQVAAPEKAILVEKATLAARRALQLDDSDPLAHVALGSVYFSSWDMRRAEAAFKRGVALEPRVDRGHEALARLYMFTARPAEQLVAAQLGLQNDPLSHSAIREYALALAMNGRCEESLDQLQGLKALDPPAQVAGVVRGLCYLSKERWPEAIAELRWASEHGAGSGPAFLGFALARSGQQVEARAILADLIAGSRASRGAMGVAVVYAGVRDYDRAFEWLDRSIDEDSISTYLLHPALADLQRDPRFERVRERLGLNR